MSLIRGEAHRNSENRRSWKARPVVRPHGALSSIVVSPKSSPAWMTVRPRKRSRHASATEALLSSKSSG